ncbi:translation initiation factor eIF-2B subunit epsilon [Trichonephila clavata]|uniref:Translation initiation factor eIF-2B subunit epsilon n=1 Tax=Trichonephila clavata TaxID=2740835 RepID=A0A8X6F641_TRICU|nr:translation initiation factor eIF-2B subunit epsilon [Trichonephila clavata]
MARWTLPFVPDLVEYYQHLGWGSTYINSANNVYKANNVEIGRQCQLMQNVIIGQGTKIGENAIIANSVIGNNCTIGKNVRLVQTHLWDGVTVGDGCDIELCVLADRVKIGDRGFLKFGCVLGSEVVIDNSVILPTLTRLQAEEVSENDSFGEDDFEENTKANKSVDKSLVGTNGHGYICNVWEEEKNEPEDPTKVSDIWGKPNDEYSEDRQWNSDLASSASERLSVGEEASGESEVGDDDYDDDDVSQFYREVLDSLQRACDENVNSANIILEINSSKHAYNISIKEVVSVLVKALLKLPFEYEPNLAWPGYKLALSRVRDILEGVIFNYIKTADTQYSCLLAIEDFMKKHQKCALAGLHLIREWYDEDILHELIIFRWFLNISPENAKIKKMMDPFIKWLGEAEEESSGD